MLLWFILSVCPISSTMIDFTQLSVCSSRTCRYYPQTLPVLILNRARFFLELEMYVAGPHAQLLYSHQYCAYVMRKTTFGTVVHHDTLYRSFQLALLNVSADSTLLDAKLPLCSKNFSLTLDLCCILCGEYGTLDEDTSWVNSTHCC